VGGSERRDAFRKQRMKLARLFRKLWGLCMAR
jgi:hypothetical protein